MYRHASVFLKQWIEDSRRKPLIIRGARQVGKSTLVRNFASEHSLRLLEVNLDKVAITTPSLKQSFSTNDTKRILSDLSVLLKTEIHPKKDLIFFDEIQAIPQAYAALRYFFEDSPQYQVVAAGSLLEVTLAEQEVSMPVGRVQFLSLGPMTFFEFLEACNEIQALKALGEFSLNSRKKTVEEFSEVLHSRMLERYTEYLWVGGMPEVVSEFVNSPSPRTQATLLKIAQLKSAIIETYRNDFGKYRRRYPHERLERIFNYASQNVGTKVKYSNLSRDDAARDLKPGVDLLERARILKRIFHTAATTIPLAATQDESIYKFLFLDTGLVMASLGLSIKELQNRDSLNSAFLGQITEQFVGQQLLASLVDPLHGLFYWIREGKAGNAEVDYVLQKASRIIVVECKAGIRGTHRSLTQFMLKRKDAIAIRLSLNPPSRQRIQATTADQKKVDFELISLPLYFAERVIDLVD